MKTSKRKISIILKFCLIGIWCGGLSYALYINPSVTVTQSKLREMQQQASILLQNGGQVVYRDDLAKYGVASLLRGISFVSLSDAAYTKDIDGLVANGWASKGNGAYCKDGVLLRFDRRPVSFQGGEVIKLDMDYSARSIHYCGI
ncbi:hypothetical protein ACFFJT_21110 [Dyella flava]|uniref:Uncharacterized protein n=1 Tax=Dyella flava TaxID=1920170 RepID=A0ABS2JZY0_9GAMM|nr:hypothetical protein [Dyella flava]MBM7124560.1 hypothetical protein [Dyella flava]